jgi:NADH:ubiquinone oxidoreductase subunit 6 (subunit J)
LSRNAITSLLFLISTYFYSSVLLIAYQLEFFALLYVIIYVGGVAVLFLFVIMMLKFKYVPGYDKVSIFNKIITLTIFSVLSITFFKFFSLSWSIPQTYANIRRESNQTFFDNIKTVRIVLDRVFVPSRYHVKVSIPMEISNTHRKVLGLDTKTKVEGIEIVPISNQFKACDSIPIEIFNIQRGGDDLEKLGLIFYTDYSYIFFLCGTILLLSIIAPIFLTYKERYYIRQQNYNEGIIKQKIVLFN